MSARAAWRLESLGFTQVYRYTPSKMDWFASGLPGEGRLANAPHAGDVARRNVSTCRLTDRLGEVRERVRAAGSDVCIVVNDADIVLGRLRKKEFDADPGASVETVMEEGPTTIRPNTKLDDFAKRLRERHVESIVVSTSDGQLVGILYREDAERRVAESQAAPKG